MGKVNLPGFTAETSLYKSAKSYAVAPNRTAVRVGALVLTRGLMGTLSTVDVPTPMPGVVFTMKKLCWDKTTSTSKFWGLTFQTECQICQWFKYAKICPQPPACTWGWVPASEPWRDCVDSLVAID